jgi:hypothetical protein
LALNNKIQPIGFSLSEENIAEVTSHEHILLQCLDIVLGAMHFRLNDKHSEKPPGKHRRAKRTVAKERLYKSILEEIKLIKPDFKYFNIGISTSASLSDRWREPYLHWNFVPKDKIYRQELTKQK